MDFFLGGFLQYFLCQVCQFFIASGVFSLGFEFLLKFLARSWDLSLEYQGFSDVDHVYNYSLLVLAEFQKFCS